MERRIGRYAIVGELATGGMAEILLGRLVGASGFERPVVIKRIRPDLDHADLETMFIDEARLASRVRHPNVVHVEDLGTDEVGGVFLVMEYLEGESVSNLSKRLLVTKEKLPYHLAAHIVAEACAGLHAAHELVDDADAPLELIHRDVSPQNVLLTYAGKIKVLDFGIAKATDRLTGTDSGTVKGKVGYMAPELFAPGAAIDRGVDIFALGIVLYELLTGHRLFQRFGRLASIRAIAKDPIVPPSRIAADLPTSLEAVAMRALARSRSDRYATASDMRRDLLQAVRSLDVGDEPSEQLTRLMKRLFSDRIEEKREMLRGFRAGAALATVPPGEVEPTIVMPDVTSFTITTSVDSPPPSEGTLRTLAALPKVEGRGSPPWRRTALAFAALLLAAVTSVAAVVVGRAARPSSDRSATENPGRSAVAVAIPSADGPSGPSATAPSGDTSLPGVRLVPSGSAPPGRRSVPVRGRSLRGEDAPPPSAAPPTGASSASPVSSAPPVPSRDPYRRFD